MTKPLWQLTVQTTQALAPLCAEWLGERASTVTELVPKHGRTTLEAIFEDEPEQSEILAAFAVLAEALGETEPTVTLHCLPALNWVQHVAHDFPPVQLKRMTMCSQRGDVKLSARRQQALWVPATSAFGTGEHATTAGCVLMLQKLRQRKKFQHVLDLGCGTGILAMVAARLGAKHILATDNDAEAIRVTRQLMQANQLPHIKTLVAEGFDHRALQARTFDLIIANIFARPLRQLAPAMRQHLCSGGYLILSGLLTSQVAGVLSAYRQQKIYLRSRWQRGGWAVLLLQKN